MSGAEPTAGQRYKDVMAELTGVTGHVRAADKARAKALRERLVGLDDEMLRASGRAALTEAVVQLHWERALDMLWAEQWMKLRMLPDPDPGVSSDELDFCDAEVQARADQLAAMVRRRWYGFGRR